jgi:DNA-binding winged helix-turn-helix (wHTH) protein/Tfp pilus assembly protein PilF
MPQVKVLDLMIELDEYAVYRDEEAISLPKLSFELFIYLIRNAEKICTLEQISSAVWTNTVVSNETIVQRITLLRKALNDDPKSPKYIESVRGRGYRLIVKPIYQTKTKNKLIANLAIALILVGVIATSYWLMRPSVLPEKAVFVQTTIPSEKSIDLVNSLLERGEYYLSVGQNENIDRAIALFDEVLAEDSSNQAALVGMSLALSKSVCRYNQPVSRAGKAKQLANQAISLDKHDSRAQAALAYSWDCEGNLERALEHYMLAVELDPDNYKSIGSAAHLLESKGELLSAFGLNKRVKKLKPDNHMTELQINRIYELLKFTPQAQKGYKQLFSLYPDNVFINGAYPRFLFFQGHFSQAKEVIEKVFKRDVERSNIFLIYAEVLWLLEGQEKALPWFRKAAKVNTRQSFAKTVQELLDKELSIEEAKARISDIEESVANGDTWSPNYIEASLIALWGLNDQEASMSLLQKAVNLGYLDSEYLTISPLFLELRKHAGFYRLVDDINLRREHKKQRFLVAYPSPEI